MANQITCSSLILLALTIAVASIPTPAGAAAINSGSDAALKKTADFLEKWKKRIEGAKDIFEAINKTTDGKLLPRGGDAAAAVAGLLPAAVPVEAVKAGGVNFSVAGVDITSTVTWTSRCGGAGEAVTCGDPLCEQYGACGGGEEHACKSDASAGVPLHQGKIALFDANGEEIFSRDSAAYACQPNAGGDSGGGDYAVIGLGRGNAIVPNATAAFPFFSYILDGDLQGSTVWVRHHAFLAERDTAARAGRRSTTGLGHDTTGSRGRFYYVGVAGIKVGSGEVGGGEEPVALGILTTTMPFTFLKTALFDHLEKELSAVVSPINGSDSDNGARFRQLCYPSGTELPAITLVFAGKDAAGMELRPEHYSYKKSSGVACLSILRSPWASGVSVIGSMVQAGRRMTYKLDDNTLTFDVTASSSASSETPTLSSSSSAAAQAKLTPFFMSHALVVLLLAIVM